MVISKTIRPGIASTTHFVLIAAAVVLLFVVRGGAVPSDRCDVCNAYLINSCYLLTDMITHEKKQVCTDCALKRPACYLCAIPALMSASGAADLQDGRVICARDARTAVLSEAEGLKICREVADDMARRFVRFLTLPEKNVNYAVIDRVHLQALFKSAGEDYYCPNVLGYLQTTPTFGRAEHDISILMGLPVGWFRSTCVHENAHAWMSENVSKGRLNSMDRSTKEGFCELLAYLYVEEVGDQDAKRKILENAYTRGQIHLFIEAEKQYGFNDIVDWIKSGIDTRLVADDLGRVRAVQAPRPGPVAAPVLPATYAAPPAAKAPDKLVLKSIIWTRDRPSAVVNNGSFFVNDQSSVRVGESNVVIRCVEIRKDAVRVRIVATGEEQELGLKNP